MTIRSVNVNIELMSMSDLTYIWIDRIIQRVIYTHTRI